MTTATSKKQERLERANKFFEQLAKLIDKDSGAAADLRRVLSGEERHLRNAYPVILRYLGGIDERQQYTWILVAALFAHYPQDIRAEQKNFGSSCRGLDPKNDSGGTERRFRALLDTPFVDLRSPLTNLVRQMKAKKVLIDHPQLLVDLLQWEHPNQYIQDRWARTFWGAPPPDPEEAIDE